MNTETKRRRALVTGGSGGIGAGRGRQSGERGDGKRGKQALSVVVLEQPASVVKAGRKPAEDVAVILEDLIKLMDSASNQLRRGRYPSDDHSRKLAAVMRAVADDFDV